MGYMSQFDRYVFLEGAPAADIAEALAIVEERLRPISPEKLKAELARLRSAVQSRALDVTDWAMRFQVCADACCSSPQDVVVAALRGWSARSGWFPTEHEIREQLREHGHRAAALAEALRHPQPRPVSPAERTKAENDLADAQAEAELLAGFGHVFTPDELMSAWRSWTGFPGCSWALWGYSYRHGEGWAVTLLGRLVDLLASDPIPPADVVREVVERGFAERVAG